MKIKIDFQKEPIGRYALKQVNRQWDNPPRYMGEERCEIVEEVGKKVLRVKYPQGIYGLEGGAQWRFNFNKSFDELFVQYKVKFQKGFNFVRGGKLPGLSGGSNPAGGADSSKGFSARLMWREKGQVEQYVYHPGREGQWGRDFFWHNLNSEKMEPLRFKPGVWHTVKTRIKMNSEFFWNKEGYIVSWLDGKLALFQEIKLREKEEKYGIDNLNFSTIFGGNDASWAPKKDEYIYFDDFIISDKDIK